MYKGYTFKQFVAALESDNFNEIEPKALEWAKWVESVNLSGEHDGDCMNRAMSCLLCAVQYYLKEYEKYTFKSEEFEKELKEGGFLG